MSSFIPHVLVVDDEPVNQTVIAAYFQQMPEEYVLESALDGVEAWEKLKSMPEKFDILVLDRMMPRMDGMELLDKIKRHPVLMHLPVIFQSALISKADIEDGMKAGANYYITKPFEYGILYSIIRTAVRDRIERLRLISELTEHYKTMSCLTSATFKFKSVADGNKLAVLLANACVDVHRSAMGLTELFLNAVEHGNLAISYEEKGELNENGNLMDEIERRGQLPDYKDREVEVVFSKSNEKIEIVVTDEGKGFAWQSYISMAPDRASDNHGRGIAMAGLVSFDKLEYEGLGNKVKATIFLKNEESND